MIRFIWLLLTLGMWSYEYWRPWSSLGRWVWVPLVLALIVYLYGWVLERENRLIPFFSGSIWASLGGIVEFHMFIRTHPDFPLSTTILVRALLIIGMIVALFLTFANYRLQHSLLNRRGNVSKQQLVVVKPTVADRWTKLKRVFLRGTASSEIELNLGEEIPMKE